MQDETVLYLIFLKKIRKFLLFLLNRWIIGYSQFIFVVAFLYNSNGRFRKHKKINDFHGVEI